MRIQALTCGKSEDDEKGGELWKNRVLARHHLLVSMGISIRTTNTIVCEAVETTKARE